MFRKARSTLMALGAIGALALGGSAFATAASTGSSSSASQSSSTSSGYGTNGRQGQPPGGGRHVGANGKREEALTGDTAAKVKAAALKKVPGGTVERVETDVDHGSPYEAHVRKADGTELEVLVNESFTVTAVNTMQHP